MQCIVTCEHGGNRIPPRWRKLFESDSARSALESHRGHDPGALELAKRLAKAFNAPLFFSTTSRLLIELNRTLGHPRIFSEFSRVLNESDRETLIQEFYRPYREEVEQAIQRASKSGPVLHLSIHSFTPVLDEKNRRTDIGLLFDPARQFESRFCTDWKTSLRRAFPELAIHRNLPYRGTSDGFTTYLRTQFPDEQYAGIEFEVNQKFPDGEKQRWSTIQQGILQSLQATLLTTSPTRERGPTRGFSAHR